MQQAHTDWVPVILAGLSILVGIAVPVVSYVLKSLHKNISDVAQIGKERHDNLQRVIAVSKADADKAIAATEARCVAYIHDVEARCVQRIVEAEHRSEKHAERLQLMVSDQYKELQKDLRELRQELARQSLTPAPAGGD